MFGSFLIPILIAFTGLAFFAGLITWAKLLKKVAPDKVAIITGRKKRVVQGEKTTNYRIVRGGTVFVNPVTEVVQYLPLNLVTLPIEVKEAYNKDGVPVDVECVANIKIKGEDKAIQNAVERFLDSPKNIHDTVKQTLEGHLRSIVGTMTIEDLNSNRKAFASAVTVDAVAELEQMGIGVDSIVIKKISDGSGYLAALGRKRTAEVKRDADIGEAEAKAEAKKKSTDAERAAEIIAAENQRATFEAHRDLETKKADYDAEIKAKQATAAQAGPRAQAEAEKAVMVAKEEAKIAQTEAAGRVQIQEAKRKEQELLATTIKLADAEKQATIVKAEGEATARMTKAEAEKTAKVAEAEGEAAKIKKEGEAHAAVIKAKLVAEAEGKKELAAALRELNEAGQLLFLMEKSPEVINALGEAGERIARGVFEPVGHGVGQIDTISVYDSGNGNGQGAVERATDIVPSIVFNFLQKCKANGMNNIGDTLTNLVTALNAKIAPSTVVEETKPESAHYGLEQTADKVSGNKSASQEATV
ncbi:MAG: hypothetical protein A3G49_03565 [Candidatus Sungbacteria bacterium RIFCSPLOWO2_12_FULL_41_11]|uniref:Band 7 domain-containing protein n=1 Tax=Candidatus Sungbacteria bacterium RIFCSPLOWO2_12_FULL_41_11 TaxID=1802286 RepID=A0A1G2LT04_9BACT|nr:MAG: hypothetical protein A3D41_03975 [Candidatus Sungbacteria bacterium RIFCSPHIGHO2_02_FULL_41_12b]OHA14778.1 MAG: hypothetical protein A3G49_03565 [Candidatus Sungbacteria bacterium RIFCSPLOWO2_12_FULL_41_11]